MIIDDRDWIYLPPHPPGKAGVREGQIGVNDPTRGKMWRLYLEKKVYETEIRNKNN